MCGRIANTMPHDAMRQLFDIQANDFPTDPPRFNIAPTQNVATAFVEGERRQLASMRWGFIPHWAKTTGDGPLLINARAETVAEKPAFRAAVRARRCLIPVSGFYEWTKDEDGGRQPWFFQPAGDAPLVLAGIWQDWQGEAGAAMRCMAILTCAANADTAPVHHRMPVIIAPGDFALWLGEAGAGAAPLMRPAPAGTLRHHRVSREVNRAGVDHTDLVLALPED